MHIISLGRARDIVSAGRARHVRKGTDSRKTAGRRIGMEGKETVARFPGAGEVAPTLENTGRHCSEMPHGPRAAAAPHPSIASRDLLAFSPPPSPSPLSPGGKGRGRVGEGWGRGKRDGKGEGGGRGRWGGSSSLFFFLELSVDRPSTTGPRERERKRERARSKKRVYPGRKRLERVFFVRIRIKL